MENSNKQNIFGAICAFFLVAVAIWIKAKDTEDAEKKRQAQLNAEQKEKQARLDAGQYVDNTNAPCSRCGGEGYLPQYHYVNNGVCYKCGGNG